MTLLMGTVSRSTVPIGLLMLLTALHSNGMSISRKYIPFVPNKSLSGAEFVRAVVVSIDSSQPRHVVTFRIEEVISGATIKVDDAFTVAVNPSGESTNMVPAFIPPITIGEEVLWLLRRSDKQLVPVPNSSKLGLQLAPSRGFAMLPMRARGDDEGSRRATQLADAVKRIVACPPDERWPLFEKLCTDKSGSVAGWAMSVMVNVDEPHAREYLEKAMETRMLPPASEEMAKALLARVTEVWANLAKEAGTGPGYWNTHSVIVAEVVEVEERKAILDFDVELRPIKTLRGPLDAAQNPSITARGRYGIYRSPLQQAPMQGSTCVFVLSREGGENVIPSSIMQFMPNEKAVLPIEGLSDPAIADVMKNLRALRQKSESDTNEE